MAIGSSRLESRLHLANLFPKLEMSLQFRIQESEILFRERQTRKKGLRTFFRGWVDNDVEMSLVFR